MVVALERQQGVDRRKCLIDRDLLRPAIGQPSSPLVEPRRPIPTPSFSAIPAAIRAPHDRLQHVQVRAQQIRANGSMTHELLDAWLGQPARWY